ncbi:unnamed protein product [Hydatigera taeniaeformis]|uniref:WW domain-containing protein n=1 Tax=Hydatigena taeniaeformis TaxID=6205 RepID=A0A0R3WNN9_HYDTA|nr:unnamed protein product [Hydatigera taeniaeformis]
MLFSYEWVELLEPSSQKVIFANLESGEIRWDSPPNARVRPLASEQWWELYDVNTQRHYYHNVRSGKTEWHRPSSGDVIPLSNLQVVDSYFLIYPLFPQDFSRSAKLHILHFSSLTANFLPNRTALV